MTSASRWTHVGVDAQRCLVYGPNFGRLYLLTRQQVAESTLQRVLGLCAPSWRSELPDPVRQIVHDLPSLRRTPRVVPRLRLRLLYRLFHYSRLMVPLPFLAAWLCRLATVGSATSSDPVFQSSRSVEDFAEAIGRLVHGVESAIGLADCYPRALLTAWLSLSHGLRCELVVGTLAPTRKMHAWCSIHGQLPYEALPEHYLYQPLLIMSLTPK